MDKTRDLPLYQWRGNQNVPGEIEPAVYVKATATNTTV